MDRHGMGFVRAYLYGWPCVFLLLIDSHSRSIVYCYYYTTNEVLLHESLMILIPNSFIFLLFFCTCYRIGQP